MTVKYWSKVSSVLFLYMCVHAHRAVWKTDSKHSIINVSRPVGITKFGKRCSFNFKTKWLWWSFAALHKYKNVVQRLHAQSMVNQNIFWCVGVFLFTEYRTLWAQMNLLVWHCWAWCVGQWCAVWMTFSGACMLGRLVRVHAVCRPDRVVAWVCILEFVCRFYRPHPSSWFVFFLFCFLKRLDLIWMIKVFAERSIMSLGTQVVLLSNHWA